MGGSQKFVSKYWFGINIDINSNSVPAFSSLPDSLRVTGGQL